jgi:hypothetical protein
MTKFRAIIAAAGLAVLLSGGVAMAASHSAGAHGNASHQHTSAHAHGAAGSASHDNNGRRDHGSSANGSHPANHGEFVSRAAHDCGHGTGDVHGDCVSAVAKSDKGKK